MHEKRELKILLICPYPVGVAPGQRLKYEQYFEFLRTQGYQIEVSPFFDLSAWKIIYTNGNLLSKIWCVLKGYLRRLKDLVNAKDYDGIYIFLHATPFGDSVFERLLRRLAPKIIYDIDDLVFLGETSPQNKIVKLLKSPQKYHFLMKKSDHVITCTPYLDAYVKKFNLNTTDISSTIKTDIYQPLDKKLEKEEIVLGWSGSHSTAKYLYLLAPVLKRLSEKYQFKLHVIGAREFFLEGIDIDLVQWSEATEVAELQKIDIGLYPLPNEQWVLGKSGLKALQYMALGIPTVATAIGANFRVIENAKSGFLAQNDDEWYQHLVALIENGALREQIGNNARARVEEYYSVVANRHKYLKVFDSTFRAEGNQ